MLTSPDALRSGVASNTDGASFAVIAAPGTGRKLFVSSITAVNTSAAAITVDIRDGLAGAVVWVLHVPAGGSTNITFALPLGGFSENTPICADSSAAATTLTVSINGLRRPSNLG